ncbi:hypothetical protein Syun_013058 [Stephania yunnanensis]|uniref:CHORD domain-containing protein n=1 Tax=Stephania yunnanensis TaxID=152371 RepID=A0AAP0K215_9MAGN
MEKCGKLRCQRIGCNAFFTDEDNPDDSCTYHDSPIFHDGMKEWSCCKQRSHDFSLFLELPGCKTGKHTAEKPVITKPPAASAMKPIAVSSPAKDSSSNLSCSRCQQGFFCSDHGSQPRHVNSKLLNTNTDAPDNRNADVQQSSPATVKKVVDINEPQTCKNNGCGVTFKEKDNHDSACAYHPGPAEFHDRKRGWKCCDIFEKEFEEFMQIPPCTKGWHNADPVS